MADMDAILDAALDDLDDDDDHEQVQIDQTTTTQATTCTSVTPDDKITAKEDGDEEKEESTKTSLSPSKKTPKSSSPAANDKKKTKSKKQPQKKKSQTNNTATTTSPDCSENVELQAFEEMMKQMLMQAANSTDNEEDAAMFGSFLQHMQAQVEAEQQKTTTSSEKKKKSTNADSLKKKKKEKKAKASSSATAAATEGLSATVDDTISKLVEDLGKAPINDGDDHDGNDFPEQGMFQQMMAEFEKLGDVDGDNNGDDNLNPDDLIDGVMQQLLSKELMYEPIQQVCKKFPKWLDDEKSNMDKDEYQRRLKQYRCFQELTKTYETEPENSEKLMMLMQDVQEYGQPPPAIIEGIAPGLQLDEDGVPNLEHMLGNNEDCTVM